MVNPASLALPRLCDPEFFATSPAMSDAIPNEQLAREIVAERLGWLPSAVRRFTTGMAFFVFDVTGGENNVVVRLGRPSQATTLRDGVRLASQLRPLGVPLSDILDSGTVGGFPYVIQSRLPGTDLGHVMNDLDATQLERIAHAVADAQLATGRLGAGTRYGYAASPDAAPHASWAEVLAASIARSEGRILANKLFSPDVVAQTRSLFARHADALAQIPATPFLHDTTTKNVIIAPSGHLSGIVDVDDLCFGDPRYPAALTRVAMLVHGGPLGYVTTWLAHADQAQDALFDFYVTTFLLDFMSEHGTAFNGNEAPSDPEGRETLLKLFEESLG